MIDWPTNPKEGRPLRTRDIVASIGMALAAALPVPAVAASTTVAGVAVGSVERPSCGGARDAPSGCGREPTVARTLAMVAGIAALMGWAYATERRHGRRTEDADDGGEA